jgi:GST-like protein
MPAIVDSEPADRGAPISVFESGAILIYLAEKVGQLIPKDLRGRIEVLEWLMWQMGGLGPMLGQTHHFRTYAKDKIPYAIDRYTNEAHRLYGVLDRRLKERAYLAGEYSIADIACWPWIHPEGQGQSFDEFPNMKRWFEAVKARPAVERGSAAGADLRTATLDDQARAVLFSPRASQE